MGTSENQHCERFQVYQKYKNITATIAITTAIAIAATVATTAAAIIKWSYLDLNSRAKKITYFFLDCFVHSLLSLVCCSFIPLNRNSSLTFIDCFSISSRSTITITLNPMDSINLIHFTPLPSLDSFFHVYLLDFLSLR